MCPPAPEEIKLLSARCLSAAIELSAIWFHFGYGNNKSYAATKAAEFVWDYQEHLPHFLSILNI